MPTTTTGIATEFIQFTRASNATVTDSDGLVKWAPHNLLLASESFDAASWTKVGGATVEANSVAAPNGTTTADRLKEATATDAFYTYQIITAASNTITFSVFAKTAQRSAIYIRLYSAINNWEAAVFDLNAGTNPQNASGSATTFTNRTQAITPIGGGWNLCSITATLPSGAISCLIHTSNIPSGITFDAYGDYAYAGNSANGVYLWGASLYRSDLAMQPNTSAYPLYNPTTPKNLLGYTEEYSGTGWARSSVTVSGPVVAPNGLSTADTITSTSSVATTVGIYNAINFGSGSTISIYAKAGTSNIAWVSSDSAQSYAVFNLATETVIASANGTPSITPVGNGWYRIAVSNVTVAGTYFIAGGKDSYTSGAPWANGTWTSGNTVHLWGAQVSDSASLDAYAPVYGAAVTSAAYYGPRRDFDGATLACKGLLVEEQRVNIVLNSAAFDAASWAKLGSPVTTVTANNAISPDGTLNADKISQSTDGISQSITGAVSTTYTATVFVKPDVAARFLLYIAGGGVGGSDGGVRFNALTGAFIGTVGAAVSSYSSSVLSNGWIRYSITFATGGADSTFDVVMQFLDASNSAVSQTGWLYGAQVEAGSFATSYIPTGAATATRNADVASVSTQAFPYSATEGTVVANGSWNGSASAGALFAVISDGGNSNRMLLYANNSAADAQFTVFNGGTPQADIGGLGVTLAGEVFKAAAAYKANDFAAIGKSGSVSTDPSGTIPSVNILHLGSNLGTSNALNGHIRQITYLPRRISNAELITRTS